MCHPLPRWRSGPAAHRAAPAHGRTTAGHCPLRSDRPAAHVDSFTGPRGMMLPESASSHHICMDWGPFCPSSALHATSRWYSRALLQHASLDSRCSMSVSPPLPTIRRAPWRNAAHLGAVVQDAHTGRGAPAVVPDAHHKHVRALPPAPHRQLREHRAHLPAGTRVSNLLRSTSRQAARLSRHTERLQQAPPGRRTL